MIKRNSKGQFIKGSSAPKTAFKKGCISPYKGKKRPKISGKNNYNWKGNNAGYTAFHQSLRRHNLKTGICFFCKQSKKTEWALKKDKKYSRNINDYFELCCSCHKKYDIGKKIIQKNLSDDIIKIWPSIRVANKTLNICHSSIVSCCKGRYKHAGGFKWSYF